MTQTPGATLGDVLANKPGVTASTFAPGASRPVVRGLDNFRVRIQENGISSMDVSSFGEDHGVPIDPLATERVEIIRGPAALQWGAQATGGIVSATNNRIPDPATPEGVTFTTKGALTTVDRGREAGTLLDARSGNFAAHADYGVRKSDDYAIPGGIQRNTFVDTQTASIGASTITDQGFAGIAVSNFQSLYGIPGTAAAARRTRIDLDQTKLLSRGEFRTGGSLVDTVRFWLGISDYKHNELGIADGVDGVRATFKNTEQEGRLEAALVPFGTALGTLRTTVGFQAGHQNLGTAGEAGTLLAPAETSRAAGYLFNELALTRSLRLQAATRLGVAAVSGTAATFPGLLPDGTAIIESQRERQFVPVSHSVALVQDLPWGTVASITGQRIERAPSALELFAKGAHDASGTFEIGDANLKKEAANSIEASLRRLQGSVRFEATAFHTEYERFIFRSLTGIRCGDTFATCGVEDELKQVVYSQRDARFTGAELIGQLDLAEIARGTFGIDGQYDFVRARFTDGTNVPRIPPQRLGGGVYWRDGEWFARVGLLHAFAQTDIAPEETPTPGYNLLKAELRYTKKLTSAWGPREITLGVTGNNLLNDDVRNHLSFRKDEVLLPGRNFRFFGTVRF